MGDSSLFQRRTNLVFQEDGIRSPLATSITTRPVDFSPFSVPTEVEIKEREPRGKGRVFRLITGNKNQVFM